MMRVLTGAAAAALTAVGLWTLGWWTVPLVGATIGILRRRDPWAGIEAGIGAMLGWGGLLAYTLSQAAGPTLETLAPVLRMAPDRFVTLSLGFAGLLGASAAAFARVMTEARPAPPTEA